MASSKISIYPSSSSSTSNSKPPPGWLEYILVNYRWVIVIFFLLPASFLYDIYYYTRSWVVFRISSAPHNHDKKVANVQRQVRTWDGVAPMCTARPGWQTISFREGAYKKTCHKVAINLVDVLRIDTKTQTVWCEPLVTMGQLTHTLVELGWTIPVVPEMDDLTVGGLVMGTGIETSSHKHGLFQHICLSYELVLADGSLVTCSKDENPDLFYSVPWSYGTLGFLTAVEMKIVAAQRFVKVEYKPCNSLENLVSTFRAETWKAEGNQFVEGLLYSLQSGVVMTANMCNTAEIGKINEIGRWYKPWFFTHVENYLARGECGVEYIPLRDYYHRHTRSIFWEIQDIIPFGNNVAFRYLLGWLVPPKVSLLKLTQGQAMKELYEKNHFIQDMLVPLDSMKEALEVFHKEVKIYPIWLCPFKVEANPGMLRPVGGREALYVDIGTYGTPGVNNYHPEETTRRIEAFVRKVKGFQMMYADSYMTLEEYREMFDHVLYDKLRKGMVCEKAFPQVYDKVNRKFRI
ncbi:Delta(24)-sterol reductase [Chionoecetes opilio]|uniref:Delta(24)-sterol reductase n=1 Tax=Chionoecetes opilio TaxID=41210 RepID=A0A8J4XZJ8_CHIOP|nr:Delta(24)-sterol reductase [Chionoecetes opilio]